MDRHHVGIVLCIDLDYDDLKFMHLSSVLDTGAVLVWKKNQMFSSVTSSFIGFQDIQNKHFL